MSEAIPAEYDGPEHKEQVIRLLISIHAMGVLKKMALYEWGQRYGVPITAADYSRVMWTFPWQQR